MDGSDHVNDEDGPGVGTNRHRRVDWSGGRGSTGAQQMSPAENEDENENERAGGEPPARRREGVQHVVNDDNKDVTRGCRNRARKHRQVAGTLSPFPVYQPM